MKSRKDSFIFALAAALSVFGALSCPAATFGTNSTMDAFVTTGPTGNLVNSNYGGAGALAIANQSASNPQGTFQSVLQFNVAGALTSFNSQFGAGQWTIHSVTLQLNATAANNGIFNPTSAAGQFDISFMQNNSWTEGSGTPAAPGSSGITYNTLSNFVGAGDQGLGTFSYGGATNGLSTDTLTLTSGLVADIESGGNVSLRMFADDTNINYLFNSKNFGVAGDRPLLTITATPEPSTIALCAAGFGALAVRRWRARPEK